MLDVLTKVIPSYMATDDRGCLDSIHGCDTCGTSSDAAKLATAWIRNTEPNSCHDQIQDSSCQ